MTLFRKNICKCGVLENASKEKDNPIRWDKAMNEYYIRFLAPIPKPSSTAESGWIFD